MTSNDGAPARSETFAVMVRSLRKERGLTVDQLAEAIGCDRGHLTNIETGRRRVRDELAVNIARATRPDDDACPAEVKQCVTWGAGPRASQYLVLAAKAYAVLENRPTPDNSDVVRAAHNVLRHRIVRSFHAEVEGTSANDLISMVVETAK